MLEVREITKEYNRRAVVDHVSFTIDRGEVLGYLGPNGSGKSTTVRMLTGLLDPTSGEVLYAGRPIREDPIAYKRVLGYVPEEPFLRSLRASSGFWPRHGVCTSPSDATAPETCFSRLTNARLRQSSGQDADKAVMCLAQGMVRKRGEEVVQRMITHSYRRQH